jgi:hypothetical protein
VSRKRADCNLACRAAESFLLIRKPTLQSTNLSGRSSQSHGPLHGGEIVIRIARIASQDDDVLYGAAPDVQPAVFALEVDWHPEAGWLGVNPGTKPVVDEDVFGVVRIGTALMTWPRIELILTSDLNPDVSGPG